MTKGNLNFQGGNLKHEVIKRLFNYRRRKDFRRGPIVLKAKLDDLE